jgi:c-di-GMP-binding flagellar brake protein YcgR
MSIAVQPGDTLQLQALQGDPRPKLQCELIGVRPPLSLLVSEPRDGPRPVFVREGQAFAARLFDGGHARAFTTRVLRACTQPFVYVHLSWPTQLEAVKVRACRRVPVDLEAGVRNAGSADADPGAGRLLDLSLSGAMLRAAPGLGQPGDRLSLAVDLALDGQPPQPITLAARLRRTYPGEGSESGAACCYGLEFDEPDPQTGVWLRAFVYERLLASRGYNHG